jgi:hypothetical protein
VQLRQQVGALCLLVLATAAHAQSLDSTLKLVVPTAERARMLGLAIRDLMATPEMQAQFRAADLNPVASTPEETAKILSAYRAKWEPFARAARITQ